MDVLLFPGRYWKVFSLVLFIDDNFLRDNVTNQTLVQLVNQMAENAAKNPYIVRALETLKYRNFPALQTKLRQEGKEVIPTVVTLAFVLEKITSAMKHNWRFLKLCNKIWSRYDNLLKIAAIYSTQAGREYSSSFRNDYS